MTASQSGVVTAWKGDGSHSFDAVMTEVNSMGKLKKNQVTDDKEKEKHCIKLAEGKEICKMRQNRFARNQVILGGKEVELQIWDLNKSEEPVFRSKNVKEDMLCLRQPVWVSDMSWTSDNTVALCSRHGQIRKYDVRSGQRRPVAELTWDTEGVANTSLASVAGDQVIVGTNTGTLGLWDFRAGAGYRGLVRKYDGCVGAVRDIATKPGKIFICLFPN